MLPHQMNLSREFQFLSFAYTNTEGQQHCTTYIITLVARITTKQQQEQTEQQENICKSHRTSIFTNRIKGINCC